jgi:RNA polymerase sigma-70 factor (ECF subfamily)
MGPSHCSFPPPEEGLRLHLALLEGDPLAPPDIAAAYLPPLADWIERAFPRVDSHLQQTAVEDAILNYIKRPRAFDPRLGDLASYLRMAARGDLRNLLCQEERRHRHRIPWKVVEQAAERGNIPGEDEPAYQVERAEEAAAWHAFLRSFAASLTPVDRRVLELILAGEHSTQVFAAPLGLGELPVDIQEREVKRARDRLMKRLQRKGVKHG